MAVPARLREAVPDPGECSFSLQACSSGLGLAGHEGFQSRGWKGHHERISGSQPNLGLTSTGASSNSGEAGCPGLWGNQTSEVKVASSALWQLMAGLWELPPSSRGLGRPLCFTLRGMSKERILRSLKRAMPHSLPLSQNGRLPNSSSRL